METQPIRDAVASVADYRLNPPLHAPATGEAILDPRTRCAPGCPSPQDVVMQGAPLTPCRVVEHKALAHC